jgi:hypothetical protein
MKVKESLDWERCRECGNPQYDCMCPIEAAHLGERKPLTATEINRREDAKLEAFYEEPPEPNMFARSI